MSELCGGARRLDFFFFTLKKQKIKKEKTTAGREVNRSGMLPLLPNKNLEGRVLIKN
jgi:hypothetical protein